MACRILINTCRKPRSSCGSVANLLRKEIKWQHHAASSATFTLGTSKQTDTSVWKWNTLPVVGKGALLGSIGLAPTDVSQLIKGCSNYPAWKSSNLNFGGSNQLRVDFHQQQQRCSYSTQPRGDGSDTTASTQVAAEPAADTQLSQKEKLKRAVKEYGSTVIVFHITISLASLGGFYLAVSSGIDMVGILKSIGVGETILQSKLATGTGTFVVAYAVHKVFAPVRIGITLTATPFIVRYLRSKGILKPPKTKV